MKSLFFLICICLLSSCIKELSIDSETQETRLVVNSLLQPEGPLRVYVTKTIGLTDTINFPIINNAKVYLTTNNGETQALTNFVIPNQPGSIGYYTAKSYFLPKNYQGEIKIEVLHPDLPEVSAISTIPKQPQYTAHFDLIKYDKNLNISDRSFYNFSGELTIRFPETVISEQWFAIRLLHLTNDIYSPNRSEVIPIDSMILRSISLDFGIAANDPYIIKASIVNLKDSNNGTIKALINSNLVFRDPLNFNYRLYLEVIALSDAYYQYITTYGRQRQALQDPFAEPTSVFTNINNGYGIFAGYNSRIDTLVVE